jgi:hypothetical protein
MLNKLAPVAVLTAASINTADADILHAGQAAFSAN